MVAPQPQTVPRYTVDEYLALDRASQDRHVYLDGIIRVIAPESDAHSDISTNLVYMLVRQLEGKPLATRTNGTRVRSGPASTPGNSKKGMYSYPDILVCDEPEYADERRDILLNPKVIFEVLSKTTEAFDRGEKFERFRAWNPSLTDYLLLTQDRAHVDHFQRRANGVSWNLAFYDGLDAQVIIDSIECRLPLAEVYDRVVFPVRDEQ